ncbi:MAG: molybdenum cofactor biosynthesis protein B, partial [Arachnia sp.]
ALAAHGIAAERRVVGDDASAISEAVRSALAGGRRIVITCGGTGVGPSDVTAETVAPMLTYELPGIAEEIRRRGMAATSIALVSREVAGVIVDQVRPPAFVLAAPGSRGGVRDAIAVVGPLLRYLIKQLDGEGAH